MRKELLDKIRTAAESDSTLLTDKDKLQEAQGNFPSYLLEMHSITKNDLIRLNRNGYALKAYVQERTNKSIHAKWVIFKEVLNEQGS